MINAVFSLNTPQCRAKDPWGRVAPDLAPPVWVESSPNSSRVETPQTVIQVREVLSVLFCVVHDCCVKLRGDLDRVQLHLLDI